MRVIDRERNLEGSRQCGVCIVNACYASLLLGRSKILCLGTGRYGEELSFAWSNIDRHTGADVGSFAPTLTSWIMGLLPWSITKLTIDHAQSRTEAPVLKESQCFRGEPGWSVDIFCLFLRSHERLKYVKPEPEFATEHGR